MPAPRTGQVTGRPGRTGAAGRPGRAGTGAKGGFSSGRPGLVCAAVGLEVGWRKRPPLCGSREELSLLAWKRNDGPPVKVTLGRKLAPTGGRTPRILGRIG
eukprot:14874451-Heterocapsa_arctica.AAC.1